MSKIYYGNSINLSGLYCKEPIKCDRICTYKDNIYWDRIGDFSIDSNKLGLYYGDGIITFSSENEQEVRLWTEGVIATMKMMRSWCK